MEIVNYLHLLKKFLDSFIGLKNHSKSRGTKKWKIYETSVLNFPDTIDILNFPDIIDKKGYAMNEPLGYQQFDIVQLFNNFESGDGWWIFIDYCKKLSLQMKNGFTVPDLQKRNLIYWKMKGIKRSLFSCAMYLL